MRESLLPPPSQIPLGYRTSNGVLMRRAQEGSGNGDPYRVSVIRDMNGYRAEYGCGCVWSLDESSVLRVPRGTHEMCEPFCPTHGTRQSGATVGYASNSTNPGGSLSISLSQPTLYFPPQPTPPTRRELELTFETEPVVGFRMWRVVTHHLHGGITEPRLQPLTGRGLWEPRERYVAQCLPASHRLVYGVHPSDTHEAPSRDCDCGTWAVKDKADLPNSRANNHGLVAIGEVYLWGRVLEFKKGYRAKYAYPKSLTLMSDDQGGADELARVYGVPVTCEAPRPTTRDAPLFVNVNAATIAADAINKAMNEMAVSMAEAAKAFAKNDAKLKALERAKKPEPPRSKPTLRDAFKRR